MTSGPNLDVYRGELSPRLAFAACAGCGRGALDECRDDLSSFYHWLCEGCAEKKPTATPQDVGRTAGQAVGRMFYAAQALIIDMLEAFEHVDEAGPEAVAALAETLAEMHQTPIGAWPLLDWQQVDRTGERVARLRDLVAGLGSKTRPDPPPSPALSLVKPGDQS